MGKYGRKSTIDPRIWKHTFGLCGPSGIGKSSTIVQVLEKTVGSDSYLILDTGKESGFEEMANASYEPIEDYKKWDAVTSDIRDHKDTDYPDLKVVVIDTVDQLIEITEPKVVELWIAKNRGTKDFKPNSVTFRGSFGGFGAPEDKLCEIILDRIWELKAVGVTTWFVFHSKTRNIVDPISNASYDILSVNISQREYEAFKTKIAVIGMAAMDRTIETQDTGRKNLVTHKAITTNRVVDESRKIYFRSDNFAADCKSRFTDIAPVIPLDADILIETLQDAINKEITKQKNPTKKVEDSDPTPVHTNTVSTPAVDTISDAPDEDIPLDDEPTDEIGMNPPEEDVTEYPDNLAEVVQKLWKDNTDPTLKAAARKVILRYGKFKDVDEDGLKDMYIILKK